VIYRYACRSFESRCSDPSLQCSRCFTIETRIIDQQVWDAVRALIQQDTAAEGNPVQVIADRYMRAQAQHTAIQSALETTQRLVRKKSAERRRLERTFREAMQCEYNETRIDRLQWLLNSSDLELEKLEETGLQYAIHAQTCQQELDHIQFVMEWVRKLCEDIDNADWVTKRRLLYMLGVKVFVYQTGTDADGHGHRWCIQYGWDGLEELLNTAGRGSYRINVSC
jgi:hypothetical protein